MVSTILIIDPLQDKEFLLKLDNSQNKETFARVAALTWQETPIEYIEGKLTGGSINLDGASALRRTCSLSMVAQDVNINNFYWGLNTKVKIEIGVKNTIDAKYPDIIWFPQGIFVLTSFNTSLNVNSYSISLSGKDKMCLLNGDVGGHLPASIDFGVEEYVNADGTIIYNHIPLKDIIKMAVNTYGNEPLHNIVILDLDESGYELLNYKGSKSTPMYLLRDIETGLYTNISLNKEQPCWYNGIQRTFGDLPDEIFYSRVNEIPDTPYTITLINSSNAKQYNICRIETNDTVGYRRTDLTYAGELISKLGDSLTSILDKIKNMLGNFEYFYDVDGRFIFQKQKNNLHQNWNPLKTEGYDTYVDVLDSSIAYTFHDASRLASFSHNPTLNNLKNDFSIWGNRQGAGGVEIPIHMRYALDKKPEQYTSIPMDEATAASLQATYGFDVVATQVSKTYTAQDYDWRELIYRMALDYFAYNKLDDFATRVAAANPKHFPSGRTGYETYYIDMLGFWRQLYDPEVTSEDDANFYWYGDKKYWHKNVDTNPTALNFWFDFLDEGTDMDKYFVSAIGSRTKVVNDKDVKAIYFEETPSILFITNDEYEIIASQPKNNEYTYIRINDSLNGFFSISSQGKSAHARLEELLYENTYCTEAVTITTFPIYYLQPNCRIAIRDAEHNINGEYIVSKLSLPLAYNGTMSITATKAADTIY